jgi:fibronectin type 3 domain-containing protein
MSWLSPRAVRRHRRPSRIRRASAAPLALTELETRLNPANVTQYHYDAISNGVNANETTLTRSNVNSNTFGKLWQFQTQGQVYAEPLVLTGVNITTGANQGMHNVVFVATEHDQLYAIDADAASPTLLWQRSFLSPAAGDPAGTIYNTSDLLSGFSTVTTVPQATIISSDITVEIGITGTPVIDSANGVIYLVAKTQETVAGTNHYVQRLYAIDIQNGADKTAPFLLGDTTYNGTTYTNYASQTRNSSTAGSQIWTYGNGAGTNDRIVDPYSASGLNIVSFNALREAQRPALNLVNGVVYMAWASHGDNGPYHGWMVGISAYSAGNPNLALTGVLCLTPNTGLGGIWMAGGQLTFDGTNFYVETGNGGFDGQNGTGTGSNPTAPAPGVITGLDNTGFPINGNYGDSFVKIALDSTTASTQHRTLGTATQTDHSNGWGMKVVDFFTPFNQNYLNATDKDLGSSAVVVVPDYNPGGGPNQFASAARPKLVVGSGKEGVIYLLDRDSTHHVSLAPVAQTIKYGGGITTTGLTVNGSAAVASGSLNLTSGLASQTGSAFFTTRQNIQQFNTTFTYTLGGTQGNTGEGVAFVIQTSAATALGTGGTSLGYGGLTPSFAVAISSDSAQGLGTQFLVNGTVVANYTETNINTGLVGSPITVNLSYDGSTVTATFTQGANVDTKNFSINLVNQLGAFTGFVGFTGATGATLTATQSISAWTFTASNYNTGYTGSMGGFGLQNNIVQNSANELSGSLDSPALYKGQMYYVEGYGGVAKTFNFTNGAFGTTPSSTSADPYSFAGSTPFISANGNTDGIVWDIDRGTNQLRAYSTDSYATELYTSAQAPNGVDAMGSAVKFQVVTVANGRAFLGSGTGDPNNFLVVYGIRAPQTQAPAAPSNLAAQPVSSSQINLTWTDNSVTPNQAFGFYIEQSPDGMSNWTQIATASGTSYAVGGLQATTTYYFRIRAYNSIGTSAYNGPVSATTSNQGNVINYPAPNGFGTYPAGGALQLNGGAAISGNNLSLTTGVGNQSRTAYTASQLVVSAFTTTFTYLMTGTQGNTADGTTFVIQNQNATAVGGGGGSLAYAGITPSFAFAINVYSGHPFGTEFLTNGTVDFNYTQTNINTSLVNVPITVTLTYNGGNQMTASISQGNNQESKTYTFASNLVTLLGSSSAWVGFTGATGGVNSTQSITSWTFTQLSPPDAPSNLQASLTGFMGGSEMQVPLGAHLTWNAAAGAVSYKIERKLTAGGTYSQIGTSNTTSFDDSALTPGSTYFYRVRATNQIGDGAYSPEVQVNTPSLPPTPNGQQITGVTTNSISFSWTNNASNADGYQIIRSVNGGTFSFLTMLPPQNSGVPNTMTFTDTGLTAGTHYDYHIEAYNLAGYSDFAGITTATLTTAPTNLQANAANAAINLTWTGPSGATSYNVYRGTSMNGEGATPIATGITGTNYSDSTAAYNTTYYYKVTAVDLGGESAQSGEASQFFAGPPTLANSSPVVINDGSAQRSQVRSLTITFSGPVNFTGGNAAAAFQLLHVQNSASVILIAAVSTNGSGQTVVTLTFSNTNASTEVDPISELNGFSATPSLADGRYQLTILGSHVLGSNGVALDGAGNGTAGSNYVSPTDTYLGSGPHLYRLFGDANGDGVDDATDVGQLKSTFNRNNTDPLYLAFLDADNSGAVDAQDIGQFKSRFNANVFN